MSRTQVIGKIREVAVIVDYDDRQVILAPMDNSFSPIKFSIDHPYIQGTKLERDARAHLDADGKIAPEGC